MVGTNNAALAATALSTAVWTGTKAGYIDAAISSRGTGDATAANQTTIIGYVDTDVAAIKTVTDQLPDAGALTTIAADAARLTAVRAAVLTDWIDGNRLDVLLDAVKVVTDALTSATATKMALSGGTIVTGTVSWDNTNATTAIFYCDDITTAAADHYKGRVVIFTSGTLQNQATDITAYSVVAGEGKFTVTALTSAPADNVTFVIV